MAQSAERTIVIRFRVDEADFARIQGSAAQFARAAVDAERIASRERIAATKAASAESVATTRAESAERVATIRARSQVEVAEIRRATEADRQAAREKVETERQRVAEEQRILQQAAADAEAIARQSAADLAGIFSVAQQVTRVFVQQIQAASGAFLGLEGGLKTFAAISGATEEEIAAITAEVRRLGIESSKTPGELAAVTTELARMGFTSDQVEDSLEGIVRASEASGESLSSVGRIIGLATRQFDESADQAQRFADVLVTAANNSATNVGQLGEALKFVGTAARSSNQDVEITTAALSALADAGLLGGIAGRNLNAFFTQLIAKEDDIRELGITLRDATGQFLELPEIIGQFEQAFATLDQQARDTAIVDIFGAQGGRAFRALFTEGQEGLEEFVEQLRNAQGQSVETANALLVGLGGALNLFSGSLETLRADIFSFVAGPLSLLVGTATNLINIFLGLPEPIRATIALFGLLAGGVVAATVAAVGAVAAYKTLAAGFGALSLALTGSSTALSLHTILQNAGAIATAAYTFATTALTTQITLSSIATAAATAATAAWNAVVAIAAALTGTYAKGLLSLVASFAPLAILIGTATAAIFAWKAAIDAAADAGRPLRDAIAENEQALRDFREELGKPIESPIGDEEEFIPRGPLDRLRDFAGLLTLTEKQVADFEVAIADLGMQSAEVRGELFGLARALQDGNEVSEEAIAAALKLAQAQRDSLAQQREYVVQQNLGAEATQTLVGRIDQQINGLDRSVQVLQQQANAAGLAAGENAELTQELEDQSQALEQSIELLRTQADAQRQDLDERTNALQEETRELQAQLQLRNTLAEIEAGETQAQLDALNFEEQLRDIKLQTLESIDKPSAAVLQQIAQLEQQRAESRDQRAELERQLLEQQIQAEQQRLQIEQAIEVRRQASRQAEAEFAVREAEIAQRKLEIELELARIQGENTEVLEQQLEIQREIIGLREDQLASEQSANADLARQQQAERDAQRQDSERRREDLEREIEIREVSARAESEREGIQEQNEAQREAERQREEREREAEREAERDERATQRQTTSAPTSRRARAPVTLGGQTLEGPSRDFGGLSASAQAGASRVFFRTEGFGAVGGSRETSAIARRRQESEGAAAERDAAEKSLMDINSAILENVEKIVESIPALAGSKGDNITNMNVTRNETRVNQNSDVGRLVTAAGGTG